MKVWKYGDDINTDLLFPGKYTYTCSTPDEIKPHLLEDLDASFAQSVTKGDLIFAGKNFGCGSSREQPVVGLKAVGIQAIVAKSFARIFYRATINQGLLLIECPKAVDAFSKISDEQIDSLSIVFVLDAGADVCAEEDSVQVDVENGTIRIKGRTFSFPKPPPTILAIRMADGLLPYTRQMQRRRRPIHRDRPKGDSQ